MSDEAISSNNTSQMASNDVDISLSVPRLNGSDFGVWKVQIEAVLTAKGLGLALEGREADQRKNQSAKSLLLLALDNRHVNLVFSCEQTKEICAPMLNS